MLGFPHESLMSIIAAIGYPGIFLAIFAESGLFFGFFLPGASLLFTAGLLSSQGFFNPVILISGVTVAAIAGDSAGFWFGRYVGIRLFLKPDSRWFHHAHLQRAEVFYEKYGARTILFARFIPIVRTFAPIVAGIANMRYRTFITYNVIGAFAWATGVTTLGYYLGSRVPFVAHYITYIVIGIVIVTTLPLIFETLRARNSQDR